MQDFIRIVQLSDTHLFADTGKTLLGINTHSSFSAVLAAVQEQPWQADLILLTGDLSQDQSIAAYQRLAQQINALKRPTYWLPGNHDDSQNMAAHLHGPNLHSAKQILIKNWQLILLDSQVRGEVPGRLAPDQLAFLRACLQQHPEHLALICLHHPPLAIGCSWLDPLGLQNAEEFFALVEEYPQIKGILCGHVHQAFAGHYKHIPVLTTPSTCFQFKPQTGQFALDIVPPGFRYLELHADGTIKSEVLRADKFADYIKANPQARGY